MERRSDPPLCGMLCFPGGKAEAAETASEAGAREMNEEVGVTPDHTCMRRASVGSHGRFVVTTLVACTWTGRTRSRRPHAMLRQRLEWHTLRRLATSGHVTASTASALPRVLALASRLLAETTC